MEDNEILTTLCAFVLVLFLWALVFLAVHTFADMVLSSMNLPWSWKGTAGLILLKILNDNVKFGNIK